MISDYEVQLNGVKDDDTSEEQTSIPHVSGNELSIRKLTEKDIAALDSEGLKVLRNIVYAKYGMRFKSETLRQFFSQFSWYNPSTDDAEGIYDNLTEIERYNVDFIKEHE